MPPLHEMSNTFFWENKKNITNLSSVVESAQRVVKVAKKKKKKKIMAYHICGNLLLVFPPPAVTKGNRGVVCLL